MKKGAAGRNHKDPMPKYLLSGTNVHGRSVTEVVAAPTADEAVRRYRARGYADVVLHTDEVMGHLFDPEAMGSLTPRDYLTLGRISRPRFLWELVVRQYRQQLGLMLILFALVAGRRLLDVPWGFLDYMTLALLLLPPAIVLAGEVFSPSRKFERAMSFNAWARWADMLAALPGIRGAVSEPQYAFYEARALAGLGRLDEALEVVRPYADDPGTPAWLYWGLLADVFHAAKLGDRAIECAEKAVEHAPDNATALIDLAMAVLRYRRDAARARPLLAKAREHEISDLVRPFLTMADGVAALEDRQPETARRLLEEALTGAERYRHTTALMGGAIDRIHVYLCLACAGTGDLPAAGRHFRMAEPRLRAHATADLLERCQTALGERA
jgi:tetratricopeptide (TPR) repeat protein